MFSRRNCASDYDSSDQQRELVSSYWGLMWFYIAWKHLDLERGEYVYHFTNKIKASNSPKPKENSILFQNNFTPTTVFDI